MKWTRHFTTRRFNIATSKANFKELHRWMNLYPLVGPIVNGDMFLLNGPRRQYVSLPYRCPNGNERRFPAGAAKFPARTSREFAAQVPLRAQEFAGEKQQFA